MSTPDLKRLSQQLVRLKLVTPQQLDDTLIDLGRSGTAAALIQRLESRNILTSYQAGKLSKGDFEGLVLGRYKLLYRNAAGSFARVFRACDVDSGRMVGLKLLRNRWAKDPSAIQQFRKEAELGQTLKHENIVPIFEIGADGDQHYFTMEFVEGGNLLEWIGIRKKLQPLEAVKCLIDIASGLHYAHSRGLMHRDLKLSNVLMSSDGIAKLVDFGLADAHQAREKTGSDGTQRTLDYATLEKNTNAPRDDPRSDLFFLGVIFYELLSGEPPLPRTRDRDVRGDFENYRSIRPIGQVESSLPRILTAIVDRLLQLSPQARYQNTGELLLDLKHVYAAMQEGTAETATLPSRTGMRESFSEGTDSGPQLLMQPHGPSHGSSSGPTAGTGSAAGSGGTSNSAAGLPTVLCVEARVKQQDMLRDYFTKHKFRVLMMGDPLRALARVKSSPPDAILLVAEGLDEECLAAFAQIQKAMSGRKHACLLVLAVKQAAWKSEVKTGPSDEVLIQPVTLRQLRKSIAAILQGPQADTTADAAD